MLHLSIGAARPGLVEREEDLLSLAHNWWPLGLDNGGVHDIIRIRLNNMRV